MAGTVLAQRVGIKPGDDVLVEVFGRSTTVKVAALVVDYTSGGASLHLRRDAARKLLRHGGGRRAPRDGGSGRAGGLQEPLERVAEEHAMLLRSFADVRRSIDAIVNGVVGSLWSMLGLGFVVGSLGVANTVTMNVLEKRRSLGLLRAVGMTAGRSCGWSCSRASSWDCPPASSG